MDIPTPKAGSCRCGSNDSLPGGSFPSPCCLGSVVESGVGVDVGGVGVSVSTGVGFDRGRDVRPCPRLALFLREQASGVRPSKERTPLVTCSGEKGTGTLMRGHRRFIRRQVSQAPRN